MVDTLLPFAALLVPDDATQVFVTLSLEKPRDQICVVVANEIHVAPNFFRSIEEFLTLNKVGLKQIEFSLADHLITLRQLNHTDDRIEFGQRDCQLNHTVRI